MPSKIKGRGYLGESMYGEIWDRGVSEGEIEGWVKFGGESSVLEKKEEWERERGERRKTREGVWKKGHMKGANDIGTLNSTW
jgi:hypothetical protein